MYENFLFTNHRESHAKTQANSQIARIVAVFFRLNQEYRTIIRAVAHIINMVQKSGMNKNIAYSSALRITNNRKNCGELILSFFLVSRLAKNITYASLKNSEG